MTQKELDDISKDYDTTGNPAVDMVMACICFHRNHVEILEKIYLRRDMYDMFFNYVASRGFEPVEGQGFRVEDVDIDKSPLDISDCMEVVYRKKKYDTGNYKFGRN